MDIFDNSQPLRDLDPLEKISSDLEQSDSEDELGLSSLADYDTYANMNISENLKNMLRMDSYDAGAAQDDTESDNDSIYKAPNVNIEEINKHARQQKAKNLNNVLNKFAEEDSDDEEEKERPIHKKKGRKTRKQKDDEIRVDENGERLIRTTEFLDSDTDDDNRVLSKKEELEMYRNTESARRAAQAKLTPAYNLKSFEDFVKRRNERDTTPPSQLEVSSREKQSQPTQVPLDDYSDDDDLVIMNDPSKLLSPDRPIHLLSPARQSTIAYRNHNKSLLSRITNEGYMYRMKMEEAAKSRGQFTSATERAKKLLEKEKNALLIDAQIKMHFDKKKNNNLDDEDDEEDQDYKEDDDEEVEEDYLNQLSGQDEDDEVDSEALNKRKINDEDEDSEENSDMGVMAMKRWKNKKIRKSIFDDSDDEEDEHAVSKKKSAPVPVHSISNFFKAKETKVDEDPVEDKPLARLKRRVIQPDTEIEEEEEDGDDAMDIDEPVTIHKTYTPKSMSGPKEKNEYFEEEAEEEEDEYYGAGGEDLDNGENLDEFEEDDLLVHDNNEHIDEATLRDAFNKQDAESDHNMIQRLLKDVTGGGLRKQKAAAEAGLMLDDIDLYDEEDNDLIAVRRAAEARRRKLLRKKGGDLLENLMSDPKTSAFAKAAQAIPGEEVTVFLSDSEAEDEEPENTEVINTKLVIQEEDDEEEEEDEDKDLMDIYSEEEDLVVDEFNPMASPLRVGLSNTVITSADDDNEDFKIETMQTSFSPLNNRRTKTMFSSPVNMNRFKRLISETNGHLSDSPRVGFGMATPKSTKDEKKDATMSTIGGFLKSDNKSKKSKLSALTKKQDAFKYI
ncbi:hypothetical protein HPULCUR_002728 [Helicostylum pulchrum]|uniref:DNA replication checkpoint mediator MRC1 domain-containing protein n=1 Tax=Helicostylum pulchrum TaxID=562976 RepID=A0ABP9XSR8_9FUNG